MEHLFDSYSEYLLKEKNFSLHTITAYLHDVREFIFFLESEHQQVSPHEITYHLVRSWIVKLSNDGLSAISINRKLASLKSFFKYLLRTKQITNNPFLKHKSLKISKKIQIPFSEIEVRQLFDVYFLDDDFESLRNRLVIELFYSTGMRRAELINLKLNAVDFYSNTIKVLGKRNKERIIPLLQSTIDLLKMYLIKREEFRNNSAVDLLILSKKGNKVSETFVYRLINDYFSSVSEKVKKSPHVLRHTFATHLLNNGADLNSVKELLGHASLSSTQIYTHSSLSELKKIYKEAHPRGK